MDLKREQMEIATPGAWEGYSLSERDRRWGAVRQRAEQAGLDGIFVPVGNSSDARYLSQLTHAAVVLPTEGRPPLAVTDAPSPGEWLAETRRPAPGWGGAMAEALRDAGLERARIGIVGLQPGVITYARTGAPALNHTALAEARRRLPNATFADATDVVGLARWVKSDEELACLRQAVASGEAAMAFASGLAHPGVEGDDVFAAMLDRMAALGCETPAAAMVVAPIGQAPRRRITSPPVGHRLERNDYLVLEVDPLWGAQGTQEEQHFVLGPVPDRLKAAEDLLREVFEATSALIRPGVTVGELIDFTNNYADRHGGRQGLASRSMLKGGGNGEEGPRVSPNARLETLPARLRELHFEENAAIVWKPDVFADDLGNALSWGGAMQVTAQGARFLGNRPLSLPSLA